MIIKKPVFAVGQEVFYINNDANLTIKNFKIEQIRIRVKEIGQHNYNYPGSSRVAILYVDGNFDEYIENKLFATKEEAESQAANSRYLPAGDNTDIIFETRFGGTHPFIKRVYPDIVEYNFPPLNTYKRDFEKKEFEMFAFERKEEGGILRKFEDVASPEEVYEKMGEFLTIKTKL